MDKGNKQKKPMYHPFNYQTNGIINSFTIIREGIVVNCDSISLN